MAKKMFPNKMQREKFESELTKDITETGAS